MNTHFNSSSASCQVASPWKSPTDTSLFYASVLVHHSSNNKRFNPSSINYSFTQAGNPALSISLWSAKPLPKASSSVSPFFITASRAKSPPKSFRRIYSRLLNLPKCDHPPVLLAVSSALDESLQIYLTFVVVLSISKKTSCSLSVFRIEQHDAKLAYTITIPSQTARTATQAVVLRGPVFLVSLVSTVLLYTPVASTSCELKSRVILQPAQQNAFLLGNTELDTIAVLATLDNSGAVCDCLLNVRPVSPTGYIYPPLPITHRFDNPVSRIAASLYRRSVIIASSRGDIATFDVASCQLLWQCNLDISLIGLFIWEDRVVITVPPSSSEDPIMFVRLPDEDVIRTRLSSPTHAQGVTVLTGVPLFPPCDGSTSSPHGHFHALWRDSIIHVNDANGACCAEVCLVDGDIKDDKIDHEQMAMRQAIDSSVPPAQPSSLVDVARKLRKRFDIGVLRFMATLQQIEEKRKMLRFVVRLLADFARSPTIAARAGVLDVRLRSVVSRADRRSGTFNGEGNGDGDGDPPDIVNDDDLTGGLRLWVAGQSHLQTVSPFVMLSKLSWSLDDSETFVIVNADVEFLPNIDESMGLNRVADEVSLMLGVRIDRCVASVSNSFLNCNIRNNENVRLGVAVPLADVVETVGEFRDVEMHLSIEASDGRFQHLGSFTMSSLLSDTHDIDDITMQPIADVDESHRLHPFQRTIYVLMQGPNAHKLPIRPGSKLTPFVTQVFKQEALTCMALHVTSGAELATVSARLKLLVDDDVTMRRSLKYAKNSLVPMDEALVALEDEMRYVWTLVTPGDTIGFIPDQVGKLLMHQQRVDEAFGHLEEMLMGL